MAPSLKLGKDTWVAYYSNFTSNLNHRHHGSLLVTHLIVWTCYIVLSSATNGSQKSIFKKNWNSQIFCISYPINSTLYVWKETNLFFSTYYIFYMFQWRLPSFSPLTLYVSVETTIFFSTVCLSGDYHFFLNTLNVCCNEDYHLFLHLLSNTVCFNADYHHFLSLLCMLQWRYRHFLHLLCLFKRRLPSFSSLTLYVSEGNLFLSAYSMFLWRLLSFFPLTL